MDGLSTSTFLYKRCIPLSAQMQCPVCHKPFKAYEGKLFFAITQYPTQTNAKKGWQFFVQQSVSLFRGFSASKYAV